VSQRKKKTKQKNLAHPCTVLFKKQKSKGGVIVQNQLIQARPSKRSSGTCQTVIGGVYATLMPTRQAWRW